LITKKHKKQTQCVCRQAQNEDCNKLIVIYYKSLINYNSISITRVIVIDADTQNGGAGVRIIGNEMHHILRQHAVSTHFLPHDPFQVTNHNAGQLRHGHTRYRRLWFPAQALRIEKYATAYHRRSAHRKPQYQTDHGHQRLNGHHHHHQLRDHLILTR